MGMFRELLMGGGSVVRTLVSTTEPHTTSQEMDTPMVLKEGAEYSVTWTGTPKTEANLFDIYVDIPFRKSVCSILLRKGTTYTNIKATMFNKITSTVGMALRDPVILELRFKVSITENGYVRPSVQLYVNGNMVDAKTDTVNEPAGLEMTQYTNLAGTFVIKKLA